MGSIDYSELYRLQDKVLSIVFETENEFYLTGGTCISRFYLEKRYSDDLDFFTNNSSRFGFAVKNIKRELQKHFMLTTEVDSKDFIRYRIDNKLQIDFINDTACRYKDVVITKENFIIDNIENILSNKITAVMGRDDPKDIFDIYLISKHFSVVWKEVLRSAHEKAGFSDDELLVRLKSFPSELLKNIRLTDQAFLNDFDLEFPEVVENIGRVC